MRSYITYNTLLKKGLEAFGFKRSNKIEFILEKEFSSVTLLFFHTCFIPHTKDYTITIRIEYNNVKKIRTEGNFYPYISDGISVDIGHIMGLKKPMYFRIADSGNDLTEDKIVQDILYHVSTFAMPFIARYSSPFNLLSDYESKSLPEYVFIHRCTLPLIYLSCGKQEEALELAQHALFDLKTRLLEKPAITKESYSNNNYSVTTYQVKGLEMELYEEFYQRLIDYTTMNHFD